ncbi:MAG: ribonuclease HII [Actinomycetota bacterium]|nr:ribonuclease HII [Actinomycetota bacterium]MDZ4181060.1 ribonuclease HII [Coriobacteriia bacterium]
MSAESVNARRAILREAAPSDLPALIRRYSTDARTGVREAIATAQRRLERDRAELARLTHLSAMEAGLHSTGLKHIAGIDEVGRGALAGPLTAAAVILPEGVLIRGLDDSKRLSPAKREHIALEVHEQAVAVAIAHVWPRDIDSLGMTAALKRVMNDALAALCPTPDHVLLDGLPLGLSHHETAVIGGDSKVASIAAASVVAKVARDTLMADYDAVFPEYGFGGHKGYGSADHMRAINLHGTCELHRHSFSPCSDAL